MYKGRYFPEIFLRLKLPSNSRYVKKIYLNQNKNKRNKKNAEQLKSLLHKKSNKLHKQVSSYFSNFVTFLLLNIYQTRLK